MWPLYKRIVFRSGTSKIEVNEKMKECLIEFMLTYDDFKKIWYSWLSVDKRRPSHIKPDAILTFLSERSYSVVCPYFLFFFSLINKDFNDKADFEEWLPAMVQFLVMNRREMIAFVFCMLDEDKDGVISKVDLFRFYQQYRDGQRVFPLNMIRSLEIVQVKRGDRIDINEFAEIAQLVPWTVFPVFRLQSIMQERFGGFGVWKRVNKDLQDRQEQQKVEEEKNKFVNRKKLLEGMDRSNKLDNYKYYEDIWLEKLMNKQKELRRPNRFIRVKKRRASDGMIKVNLFNYCFGDQVLKKEKVATKKRLINKD